MPPFAGGKGVVWPAMTLHQLKGRIGRRIRWIELLPILISPSSFRRNELVIITGADSSHFQSLLQLLASLRRHEPGTRVVVFDLGLTKLERTHLYAVFTAAEVRNFEYVQFPDHFNIKVEKGQYAWKPVILSDALTEFKCTVCWMDAGNIVTAPLTWLRRITNKLGIYSSRTSGAIRDWTHPGTLQYLGASGGLIDRHNLCGACVAASYQNIGARRIIERWKECALVKECIAPAGSSRANHRQDQAVLSVLAHKSGITAKMPVGRYGYKIQQDID